MIPENLLTRKLDDEESIIYQLISSEAICLKEEPHGTAYSVLVAHTDGEAVLESALAYDVSRREEKGRRLMEELWRTGAEPAGIKEAVAELL